MFEKHKFIGDFPMFCRGSAIYRSPRSKWGSRIPWSGEKILPRWVRFCLQCLNDDISALPRWILLKFWTQPDWVCPGLWLNFEDHTATILFPYPVATSQKVGSGIHLLLSFTLPSLHNHNFDQRPYCIANLRIFEKYSSGSFQKVSLYRVFCLSRKSYDRAKLIQFDENLNCP